MATTNPSGWLKLLACGLFCIALGLATLAMAVLSASEEVKKPKEAKLIVFIPGPALLGVGTLLVVVALRARSRQAAICRAFRTPAQATPEQVDGWQPGEEVTNLKGSSPAAERDYFVAPPTEIGPVTHACSSMASGEAPRSLAVRLLTCSLIALAMGTAIYLLFNWLFPKLPLATFLGCGTAAAALFVGWKPFRHSCYYVGASGIARYGCSGNRGNLSTSEAFLFADAVKLKCAETDVYKNETFGSQYQHTDYNFEWLDGSGHLLFQITGEHAREDDNSLYDWAKAAEKVWTEKLLEQIPEQLEDLGYIEFSTDEGEQLLVGPGFLKVQHKSESHLFSAEQDQKASLAHGTLTLIEPGGHEGIIRSRGVHKFHYGKIGNAQLFLLLLESLARIPIQLDR